MGSVQEAVVDEAPAGGCGLDLRPERPVARHADGQALPRKRGRRLDERADALGRREAADVADRAEPTCRRRGRRAAERRERQADQRLRRPREEATVHAQEMLGACDDLGDGSGEPAEAPRPQPTQERVRPAGRSVPPHERRAGTEQVVVVQGVDDRDGGPPGRLPDGARDAGQVVRVDEVRARVGDRAREAGSRNGEDVPQVVAEPARPARPPVGRVQDGRLDPVRRLARRECAQDAGLEASIAQKKTTDYLIQKAQDYDFVKQGEGLIAVERSAPSASAPRVDGEQASRVARWIKLFFGTR